MPIERPPKAVRVVEVGPRDGLQNEPDIVPLDAKVAFIERLADAGLPVIEVGSFVRPDRVSQMADTEEVVRRLASRSSLSGSGGPASTGTAGRSATTYVTLVPNRRGLERAMACGMRAVAVFTAASEAFARANIGMTVAESLDIFREIVGEAGRSRITVRGYVSTAWWCPYSGHVKPDAVRRVAAALLEMGCAEIGIADTIGAVTPVDVQTLLERLLRDVPAPRLGVHFHDTRGTALANVLASLEMGITTVDASAGGLGGCPFAPGALGNLATEDLLYMLHGMGIETGVNLEKVGAASREMEAVLGRRLPSRYLQAGLPRATGASRSS
jgi:hydroxymethylglutaryl-CoA lyase